MATVSQPAAGQPMFVPPAGNQAIYYHPQMAGGAVIMVRPSRARKVTVYIVVLTVASLQVADMLCFAVQIVIYVARGCHPTS